MDDSWRVPFARFLVERGVVAESKVRYHVLWVERLLAFAPVGHDPVGSETVSAFLAALGRLREPRQVEQAQEAARLYRFFRREGVPPGHPAPADWDALLLEAVRVLRLQRLSVRTERSYLAWWRRFRDCLDERAPVAFDVSHVEAFLSHLAVDEGVAASTQDQA